MSLSAAVAGVKAVEARENVQAKVWYDKRRGVVLASPIYKSSGEGMVKKGLLCLLGFSAMFTTACVAMPRQPWEDSFFVSPFLWTFPFWLFGLALYLLPTIIVIARRKKKILGPILVNVLLGWTFIGWIVALIWACLVEE